MRNKKDQQAIAQITDEQGNTVSDPITMAQLFNEYFVSAPGKVESGLPGGNGLDTSGYDSVSSKVLAQISEVMVARVEHGVNAKKILTSMARPCGC
ncbi:hypothetical protein J6590_004802 [Homalodisca vitripennis]|nr:hypothetical protein J6590_004802 [Homalodisca vitripennis]